MRNAITNAYSDAYTYCDANANAGSKSYSYTKGAPESATATVVVNDNGRARTAGGAVKGISSISSHSILDQSAEDKSGMARSPSLAREPRALPGD